VCLPEVNGRWKRLTGAFKDAVFSNLVCRANVDGMRKTLILGAALSIAIGTRTSGQCGPPALSVRAPDTAIVPFEDEIKQFEASDKANPPRIGGVVFVGSSSIRLWPNLQGDFPGVNVIQRGFGGSELWEVVDYTPRIVLAYCPKRIVLYAGDNDLAAGRSPEQILSDYRTFVELVRGSLPAAKIGFVAIKPSGSRWALADKMRRANELVRDYSATVPGLVFIDAFTSMLGPNGAPRADFFVADSLHMNARGYALWRDLLAPFVYGSDSVRIEVRN
jgi:GDSL-like Lipase/Acylhydrolase family